MKLAIRQLLKNPGFTAVAVLTLALGIGANTAIFSFFHGILHSPLPYHQPETLVVIKKQARDFGDVMGEGIGLASADFTELKAQTKTLEQMTAFTADVATLTGRGNPDLVFGTVVTPNFFSVLGSRAAIGRTFTATDTKESGARLAVLGHGYWQSNLGADPAIIGQSITLNGVTFTITGVMPPDFNFPRWVHFWVTPAGEAPENRIGQTPDSGRGNIMRSVLGRLRPGVSIQQAEEELSALVKRLPDPNAAERSVHLVNMRDQTLGNVRPALLVLFACVALVLLIACLNVANLMLLRAASRQREVGIRLALGAGRWRIVRQLLAEGILLAMLGGAAGVALSSWGLNFLVSVAPYQVPRLSEVRIDAMVFCFAFGVSLLTGILCGLFPILSTATSDLTSVMKPGERGGSAGPMVRRLRSSLVAGEVAISLVLLIAAGLLLRSFWKVQSVSWGFEPVQVVSARVGFTDKRYLDNSARLQFYRTLLDKLESTPGFEAAGVNFDRIGETWVHLPFTPEGQNYATPDDAPQASYHIISPDYFKTLGIPLVQGRAFTREDNEKNSRVVIVDAAIARRFFPNTEAVGKRLQVTFGEPAWAEIVGVTDRVKSNGPEAASRPDLYLPFPQAPINYLFVHVRTPMEVGAAGSTIKRLVHEIDGNLPVADIAGMSEIVSKPAGARRFPLRLLGAFAGLAVVLAAVGIYAVTACAVAQRTREIGVRMALGAQPRAVMQLVVSQGFRPIAIGLIIGIAASGTAALGMRKMLFGVEPLDFQTFALVPLFFATVALAACLAPARKAIRVNPIEALKHD